MSVNGCDQGVTESIEGKGIGSNVGGDNISVNVEVETGFDGAHVGAPTWFDACTGFDASNVGASSGANAGCEGIGGGVVDEVAANENVVGVEGVFEAYGNVTGQGDNVVDVEGENVQGEDTVRLKNHLKKKLPWKVLAIGLHTRVKIRKTRMRTLG
ncbi:hypothetical protein SESBI_32738 [Sesbania bispinosa]|nr:hypothetical protein SESBI_32738 [Sesbania bispinosa]